MGKITGFKEYKRVTYTSRPAKQRVGDYKEIMVPLADPALSEQACRCMDCGIPFCHALGCPVINLIPEWNDLVYRGKWHEAYLRLELTNNLPEITGRICPAPCEASCTLSINSAPVTIKQIEYAIIENAFRQGWVVPRPPRTETGKKIAVIGSGPAGLAAAQQLRRSGHTVVVFERADRIGGILRYGIPDFKLEKWVLDRRIKQMEQEGVTFETGMHMGMCEDMSARYLKKSFDVILITTGAGTPRDLDVPGRELDGVHFAMEYLTQSNRFVAGLIDKKSMINAEGKNVVVIGGGDTGSDCVGTAHRQGAAKVYQFEIMPKPVDWKESYNPSWPAWPQILRTSTSHEEGCERDWNVLTTKFTGKNGKLDLMDCTRVEWNKNNGRMEMKPVSGSEFSLKVDLVLLAMGFLHVEHHKLLDELGVVFDNRGNILSKEQYATSVPGVFASGDAGTGASLVVRAIFHGRQVAESINSYLKS
jgi:glutamate synthase (NADPH/NADH) small chain